MTEYHKIQTFFKRDEKGHIIEGNWSLPEFEYLKNNLWIFTEKVDGTNIRVIWTGKEVLFGGKTDRAQIPSFLFFKLREIFYTEERIKMFLDKFGDKGGVCLYGEGYGARIQNSGVNYIKDGVDFVLFDVKIGNWWLKREDVEEIANYFGIRVVPVIGEGTIFDAIEMCRKGFNSQWGNFLAEGIVARPKIELKDRKGDRIIGKIKCRDFM